MNKISVLILVMFLGLSGAAIAQSTFGNPSGDQQQKFGSAPSTCVGWNCAPGS
jgi:hypothetical protein